MAESLTFPSRYGGPLALKVYFLVRPDSAVYVQVIAATRVADDFRWAELPKTPFGA
jgi:hypothetical protein